jgi:hypothetical protein
MQARGIYTRKIGRCSHLNNLTDKSAEYFIIRCQHALPVEPVDGERGGISPTFGTTTAGEQFTLTDKW